MVIISNSDYFWKWKFWSFFQGVWIVWQGFWLGLRGNGEVEVGLCFVLVGFNLCKKCYFEIVI